MNVSSSDMLCEFPRIRRFVYDPVKLGAHERTVTRASRAY